MITFKKFGLAVGLCATAGLGNSVAMAQSTDGYHSIQVFPVVVDTASFAQRFTFRNPNSATVNISPTYFPGTGTSQAAAFGCPTFSIAAGADRTFTSLRSLCPALAAGSQFGYLYTYEINGANLPYAAFSRVANPQGNGFSVEAFAASEFTSAVSVVTGVRRQAATVSNPAFQTNCFVGNLNDITPPGAPVTTIVGVIAYNSAGTQIGGGATFPLTPGKLTRVLDVFTAVGAAPGDYLDARVRFNESGVGEPGVFAFCTVQDNTSFGADFRIAKQEDAGGGANVGVGPQDDHSARLSNRSADAPMSGLPLRAFEIGTGSNSSNTHVVYFKHPDWVQCELIDPATGVRALPGAGMEMRMLSHDGATLLAGGGTDTTGFGEVYLGDKPDRNSGSNTRYTIEVESNGFNTGVVRPYTLRCQSGSGHTLGDIIRYKEVIDRF